jgi:hypothetical protein
MDRSLHYRWMDERKKVVSTSRPTRIRGRLVAFVDMKVDELWKNDNTLLEINTGNGKPLSGVQPEKSNDGTGKRATKSLWCKEQRYESEMLGGPDAGQYHHPGTSLLSRWP